MKIPAFITVAIAATSAAALSTPAYALVQVVNQCQTSNGAYRLMIVNNEGIGPDRTLSYSAEIYNDQDRVVGVYPLKQVTGVHSISFGRPQFVDARTGGEDFHFYGPSTNFRNIILKAKLRDGTALFDDNLKCNQ